MAVIKRRAKKITKQEMKEDKFVTTIAKWTSYAKENVQSAVLMIVALVVIVGAVFGWRYYRSKHAENAENRLGIAQAAYLAGQFMECRDTLFSLVDHYGNTKQAKVALYLLGHIYYGSGMPDSAAVFWEKFIESDFKDKDMRAGATMGLAAVLSDRGQYAEAAAAFEKGYADFPDYVDRGDWLFKAAENYRAAGQMDKAKSLLEKFIEENNKSPKLQRAKLMLAEINAK